jgi:predicted NAD/FAD-dependent oxidoreductase
MHLSEVAATLLFPGGSKVPKVGKRGNRGKSLGWTGSQSYSKKNSHTAEPTLIHGSLAFSPLFVNDFSYLEYGSTRWI